MISFDSTLRSNLSVGLPIDLMVYRTDSLALPDGKRIDENDEYFRLLRTRWSEGLRQIFDTVPESPEDYWV